MSRVLAVVATLFLSSAALPAEEPVPDPLQRMDQAMLSIGGQLRNAESRISRGMKGMSGVAAPSPVEYKTLAVQCCRSNVEAIRERMMTLQDVMEETRRHYTERQDRTALNLLDQMDTRLRRLAEATMTFVRAPDQDAAVAALKGAVLPWNEFRNGIEALRGCCPMSADGLSDAAPAPEAKPAPGGSAR
jgi:hypothetical protein